MINVLKNNKGEATYIYLCILVLVLSMLLSVLILYMGLCSQVEIQKRDVKHKLDGYLSEVATEEFNSLKQGESYEYTLTMMHLVQVLLKPWDLPLEVASTPMKTAIAS